MEPAALLAEPPLLASDDDARGLGVGLADMVLAVVVLGAGEVGVASLDLAAECLEARRLGPLGGGE